MYVNDAMVWGCYFCFQLNVAWCAVVENVLTNGIITILIIKHIGNAKVAGMETDLRLQPGEFNTAMSIFYVGYILGDVPSNMAVS
jgi:hypothetical protein